MYLLIVCSLILNITIKKITFVFESSMTRPIRDMVQWVVMSQLSMSI